MIVRRPAIGEREVLEEGKLDLLDGLVGMSLLCGQKGWFVRVMCCDRPKQSNGRAESTAMFCRS
jgi:hypothetical protein